MNLLHSLLDRQLEFPPEYGPGLSSHLPMALHALAELGADADRLNAFQASYSARFADARRLAPAVPEALADWTVLRGDFAAFGRMRGHFAAAIAARGRDAALREALPALWPGVAAAAFHGPIRVAHAVQAGHDGELAAALAYWAARWQAVVAAPPTEPALDFETWFRTFMVVGATSPSSAPLISARIAAATGLPRFVADAGRLAPPADAATTLARSAAQLYAETGNFTVLHLVTAARALRVLAAWEPPQAQHLWPAVAAALVAAGVTRRGAVPARAGGWPEVVAAARASDDDHVIKLVHACVEHAAVDGDRVYLLAAQRATG